MPILGDSSDANRDARGGQWLHRGYSQARDSNGLTQLYIKLVGGSCMVGTACIVMIMLILTIIMKIATIGLLIVGAINVHNCQVQNHIPIWMIVFGAFSIISSIIGCCCGTKQEEGEPYKLTCCKIVDNLISLFMFIWLIVGSVWVYGAKDSVSDVLGPTYCDHFTYAFAYWFITLTYVIIIGFIAISVAMVALACIIGCIKKA